MNPRNPIRWMMAVAQDAQRLKKMERNSPPSFPPIGGDGLRAAPITPAEQTAVIEALTHVAPGIEFEWFSSRPKI